MTGRPVISLIDELDINISRRSLPAIITITIITISSLDHELSSSKQLYWHLPTYEPHHRGRIRSKNTIDIIANPGRILQADYSDYDRCEWCLRSSFVSSNKGFRFCARWRRWSQANRWPRRTRKMMASLFSCRLCPSGVPQISSKSKSFFQSMIIFLFFGCDSYLSSYVFFHSFVATRMR